ncbi:MAG TPA: sigma-70 family RNA polymerase sigma factor [Atribacterota bacterium]|nr:sigma-70 family RNA polymerase sigma factor [Atribacterota bacterium]
MDGYVENYVENMILEECLDELDKQEHQIVVLYYWWGYRDAEIGKILGESQQMINYRRNRALKKIKSLLEVRTLSRFGGRRGLSGQRWWHYV